MNLRNAMNIKGNKISDSDYEAWLENDYNDDELADIEYSLYGYNSDERIRNLSDIQSFKQYDDKYVGKSGYFTDSLCHFKDLDNECTKDVLANIYGGEEAGDYIFECSDGTYRFFLPESLVKKSKKKYRSYTDKEFLTLFDLGKFHSIRVIDNPYTRVVITGTYSKNDILYISVSNNESGYGVSWLFKHCEYFNGEEWKPFGIEE